MTRELSLEFEIAIRAGLDAVWELLTTSEGRAAWFGTEAEMDLVVGGASRVSWGGEQPIDATVTDVDAGSHLRLAYLLDGEELGVEEYWVQHDDGVTTVRLIQTMTAQEDGWEGFHGDLERGWRLFLTSLRFAAETAVTPHRVAACRFAPMPGDRDTAWRALLPRLGLDPLTPPGQADRIEVPLLDTTEPADVALIDPPNSLLVVTPRRSLLLDLEGGDHDLVAYMQSATHGDSASADASWRRTTLDALAG